jgi:hypothetical protein
MQACEREQSMTAYPLSPYQVRQHGRIGQKMNIICDMIQQLDQVAAEKGWEACSLILKDGAETFP